MNTIHVAAPANTTVKVNGVPIDRSTILAEAQYHPAESADEALNSATRALVIRELLLQHAGELGIEAKPLTDNAGRAETDEEARIRGLMDAVITVPECSEIHCRRYYDDYPAKFTTPDLYEAAHILFAADPAHSAAYEAAAQNAQQIIDTLQINPTAFSSLAHAHSQCSSAQHGGSLGQFSRGDTVPEFDAVLATLQAGELCTTPVRSRFGAHVLRLDNKINGRLLPFAHVQQRIADYLQEAGWRHEVARYIQLLLDQAKIESNHVFPTH